MIHCSTREWEQLASNEIAVRWWETEESGFSAWSWWVKSLCIYFTEDEEMRYMYMREGTPLLAELEGIGVALRAFDM